MKSFAILASIVLSIFFLLPTLLPENSPVQKYLLGKKLNLGLDLRGGIHVVLGVEIQKALDVEIDKFVVDLTAKAKEKELTGVTFTRSPTERVILANFQNEKDIATVDQVIRDSF